MTDKLIIFDTTLRDGEQSPGASMTRDEKIRIARQLEKLRVDVIEAGFPGSVASNWFLLAGPAALSPEIVGRLRTHLAAAMAEPAARERWAAIGMVSLGDPSPAESSGFVAREAARWAPVVRASGA